MRCTISVSVCPECRYLPTSSTDPNALKNEDNIIILFCQSQPQFQLSWAGLALFFILPAALPPISSPCFVTLESSIAQNNVQSFENRPPGKTTSIEDDF